MRKVLCLLVACTCLCWARDKKTPLNDAGNDNVDIHATILEPEQVHQIFGTDLPGGIIVVRVQVTPQTDTPLPISADDFLLLSHHDGQRATCYTGSQIAGNATLVVQTTADGGQMTRERVGPIWGGLGGSRPRQADTGPPVLGNTGSQEKDEATVTGKKGQPQNPLVALLDQKRLPDKQTTDPVSGLLYFQIDGKVKNKDLELIYQGQAGRLYIGFPEERDKKK
jgi:hypothetical protein